MVKNQFNISPIVMNDVMGGFDEIKEGFSHRFNSKINVDFTNLYAETGFD